MKIEGTWKASSVPAAPKEDQDLSALAGRWSCNIEIIVSNPASYSDGAVEQHITSPALLPSRQPPELGQGCNISSTT